MQLTVAGMVLSANVYFQITDNAFVATVNAGFAAMGATWLVSKYLDWLRGRQLRARLARAEQRRQESLHRGVGARLPRH